MSDTSDCTSMVCVPHTDTVSSPCSEYHSLDAAALPTNWPLRYALTTKLVVVVLNGEVAAEVEPMDSREAGSHSAVHFAHQYQLDNSPLTPTWHLISTILRHGVIHTINDYPVADKTLTVVTRKTCNWRR